jgi:hypothetical protein
VEHVVCGSVLSFDSNPRPGAAHRRRRHLHSHPAKPCALEPVNSARRLSSSRTGSARATQDHGPRAAASCVPTVPAIGGSALGLAFLMVLIEHTSRWHADGGTHHKAKCQRPKRHHRRSGDPSRICREGKLELTEALRSLDRSRENSRRSSARQNPKGSLREVRKRRPWHEPKHGRAVRRQAPRAISEQGTGVRSRGFCEFRRRSGG